MTGIPQVGEPAPDFTLQDVHGTPVTLSDLPAGATAQLKSSDGKVLADFENGVASTPANQFTLI